MIGSLNELRNEILRRSQRIKLKNEKQQNNEKLTISIEEDNNQIQNINPSLKCSIIPHKTNTQNIPEFSNRLSLPLKKIIQKNENQMTEL